jgi:hypothetical protein
MSVPFDTWQTGRRGPVRHATPRQRDRLLTLLKSRAPGYASVAEIIAVAGVQYGARIYELRGLGHRIESKPGGGWFRLATRPTAEPKPGVVATPSPASETDRLFPDDVPPRHLDLG